MDTWQRITISFVLLFIILPSQIHSVAGDGGKQSPGSREMQDKPPYLTKLATDTISLLKKSHSTSWDKVKTIIHDLQLQLFPPNLDFRSADEQSTRSENDGREKIKEVVGKCLGTGIKTAEKSAESAAQVMGEAMHKAVEKVKNSLSITNGQEDIHDEL